MINIEAEKNRTLSTQDVYDILDFSIQAAEDNGFMNTFIFSRAIYCFAAIRFYIDRADELQPLVAGNINEAWDYLLDDGTIEDMMKNHQADLDYLADNGAEWFEGFGEYIHSARGLLNTIQEFSGDIVAAAVDQFKNAANETGVQEALEIADKWGMNNEVAKEEPQSEEVKSDSMFED